MQTLRRLMRTARWGRSFAIATLLWIVRPVAHAEDRVASIIPVDRRMDWKPGIPGGIPAYPVFTSAKAQPYGAKGDGKVDDTASIQRALDECPEGKGVHLPAGTYRTTKPLNIASGIVLRGDGPEKTRLINEATSGHAISVCNYDNESGSRVVGGAVKGSTIVTVGDASRFKVGDLLLVDQRNDPDLVEIEGEGGVCRWAGREGGLRAMGQLVRLTGKDGNTLTLSRPLAITFKDSLAPEVVRSSDRVIVRAGVEDLYLETTRRRTDESSSVKFWNTIHCWVRNIESARGWSFGHVTLKRSLACEVRDSYFHHAHAYGSGHGYGVLVTAQSTDALVENNACYHLNSGLQAACSGPGNVFAYNFSFRMFGRDYPETDWAHADLCQHAAHPFLNLYEGNQVGTVCFDFYWGSSSHNTLFRNAVDMRTLRAGGQPMTRNIVGLRIDKRNRFVNAVGNVLGHDGMKGGVQSDGRSDFSSPWIWSLGHPGDPLVSGTLLRHGNHDYVSGKTQWDPKIADHRLPDSLYLAAKPAFFKNLPWPPIGPDRRPLAGSIPARERFLKIPAPEREALDLLYLGEFQSAAGRSAEARAAFQEILAKYPGSPSAPVARAHIDALK